MWRPISTAPFDRDIELAVMDKKEPRARFSLPSDSRRLVEYRNEEVGLDTPNPLARMSQALSIFYL